VAESGTDILTGIEAGAGCAVVSVPATLAIYAVEAAQLRVQRQEITPNDNPKRRECTGPYMISVNSIFEKISRKSTKFSE